ncbi:MAG TPA: glucosidase [Candidatus Angelobacter sp.]|jgi:glycogen debranching enzyme|nr:glucosidase [Candidatus Angelobacter sp.]
MTKEEARLKESHDRTAHWKRWGPYVSERAWGTVREDYSATGEAWDYFPHDHARSRAYRWNEDGLAGICDRHQRLCFALALWNGRDPILKERLFGLNGSEGNHGEDVKEYYFYLDSTPTHSYMKYLYKYPQAEYPYAKLVAENHRRTKSDPEFELMDTGVFNQDRYFDVFVEYAKADWQDMCIRITAANRGPEAAEIHLLPTLWFRNTWSWAGKQKPVLSVEKTSGALLAQDEEIGDYRLHFQDGGTPLFTENETNSERIFNAKNASPYVKDAFHRYVVNGEKAAINPALQGTKAAVLYKLTVPAGGEVSIILRLKKNDPTLTVATALGKNFEQNFADRKSEADEFYASIIPSTTDDDTRNVMRQALGGLLWTKQYYHYVVRDWLAGDPAEPPPPAARKSGRNHSWGHVYNADIISMPDKWEYPWYAAWDLGFHCVALAMVDTDYAKDQLVLMLREWYMHPNGQIPAYEWAFGDVNPPVHAWATYQVYLIDKAKNGGVGDTQFLERVFHKLLLNFTWWVNRKDPEGMNIFQGGFLGLDNIGVFDRSAVLPTGGQIEQSDGTSWMATYSLDMLAIALELAAVDATYQDVASKFWEHFIYIARAMNDLGNDGLCLWDQKEGFFYDVLQLPNGSHVPLRVRSMVGLIPLFAVQIMEPDLLDAMPGFKMRLEWFVDNRKDLTANMACMETEGHKQRRLFSIVDRNQLELILAVMLDENEFFSPHGIRALSRYHKTHPYMLDVAGINHQVDYEPAESTTGLFGGNSNWRGPVWFPVNYLLVQALRRFHAYFHDSLRVECPTGSGKMINLDEVADELSRRLISTFQRDAKGRRPVFGTNEKFQSDPHWRDYLPFHEYFHGDTGAGVGASHQTGWTALVARMIDELAANQKLATAQAAKATQAGNK